MKTHRKARIAEVIREVAAETILFELSDPRIKGVTVYARRGQRRFAAQQSVRLAHGNAQGTGSVHAWPAALGGIYSI